MQSHNNKNNTNIFDCNVYFGPPCPQRENKAELSINFFLLYVVKNERTCTFREGERKISSELGRRLAWTMHSFGASPGTTIESLALLLSARGGQRNRGESRAGAGLPTGAAGGRKTNSGPERARGQSSHYYPISRQGCGCASTLTRGSARCLIAL